MITKEITPFFGRATVAAISIDEDKKIGNSPVKRTITYQNYFNTEVTVVERTGLKYDVNPNNIRGTPFFVIRIDYVLRNGAMMQIGDLLSRVGDDSGTSLKIIKEAFDAQRKIQRYPGGLNFSIDYRINIEDIRTNGGTIYHHETDTIISISGINNVCNHPYSEDGVKNRKVNSLLKTIPESSFGYNIELVDNTNKYGARFININNNVYKLNTIIDNNRADGAYITSNIPTDNETPTLDITVKHVEFENFEENGLFRTAEEAKHLGDLETARKIEVIRLENESLKSKNELQIAKHEQDMNKLTQEILAAERSKEAANAEIERQKHAEEIKKVREQVEHDMKVSAEREKYHFESRSQNRKDISDGFKLIPATIIGLSAIAGLIYKFW